MNNHKPKLGFMEKNKFDHVWVISEMGRWNRILSCFDGFHEMESSKALYPQSSQQVWDDTL